MTGTYDYYRRIGTWPKDLRRVTPPIYDRALRFYLDGKVIEKTVPFDKVWDLSYWRAAG